MSHLRRCAFRVTGVAGGSAARFSAARASRLTRFFAGAGGGALEVFGTPSADAPFASRLQEEDQGRHAGTTGEISSRSHGVSAITMMMRPVEPVEFRRFRLFAYLNYACQIPCLSTEPSDCS